MERVFRSKYEGYVMSEMTQAFIEEIPDTDVVNSLFYTTQAALTDYLSYTYQAGAGGEFVGQYYGSFWLKQTSQALTSVKELIAFNSQAISIAYENDNQNNLFLRFTEPTGEEFVSNIIPSSSDWRWIYFYVDFVTPASSFIRYDNTDLGFATLPTAITAPQVDITQLTMFQAGTVQQGSRFARIWVDFTPSVDSTKFLSLRESFAVLSNPNGIYPRVLNARGDYPTKKVPSVYVRFFDSIALDSRQEDMTQEGVVHYEFNNNAPIGIIL